MEIQFDLYFCALCEKCTPRAFIGFSGHKMLNNRVLHCFCLPNHDPSHLRLFSMRLETSPNVSINCNTTLADCMSSMKIVVSSACWLSKIILSLTVMAFIYLFFLKAFASNSTARTNSEPDKGSPCLTPLLMGKYSEVWPLFIMQLFALLYKVENHCIMDSPKLKVSNVFSIKSWSRES